MNLPVAAMGRAAVRTPIVAERAGFRAIRPLQVAVDVPKLGPRQTRVPEARRNLARI
jgi:hypothetical protein